jgi:hypothetical protein
MIPTAIGIVIALVGMILLIRTDLATMFGFVIFWSLFGGAAAITLPALGGSSILPVHFALLFLLLRCLLPGSGQGPFLRDAVRANLSLAIFAIYGVAMSWVGPRLFAEQIAVVPMRYTGTALFVTTPLGPTSQNVTAAVYLLGTLTCALGAYVACRNANGQRVLVRAGVLVCVVHVWFGLSDVLLSGTGYEAFLSFFRNGSYAQLDQHIGTISRMNGIFPEPSSFSAYGFVWFVFLFECWLRNVSPRATGPAAAAMALTLLLSTSSTAYLGLGLYAVLFGLRTLAFPMGTSSMKLIRIAIGLMAAATLVCATMLVRPDLYDWLSGILADMTVNKQGSTSALQRSFWAYQGLKAFTVSFGLGVGPGSFRSSSQFTALIGATGLIGLISFTMYLILVVKPLRASTFAKIATPTNAIGVAAGWSALCIVVASGFTAPSPDPGSDFAVMAGASLALRRRSTAAARDDVVAPGTIVLSDQAINAARRRADVRALLPVGKDLSA